MMNFLALSCTNEDLHNIILFIKLVYTAMQIAIPVLLILFGTIDLGKAVMAGEEKEIKAATDLLLKRAIAAIAVFLLFIVVKLVTGIVGGNEWKNCWSGDFNAHSLDINNTSMAPFVEKIDL